MAKMQKMKSIMNILLAVPASVPQNQLPAETSGSTWLAAGAVIALLIFIYLLMALMKPERF
jgi:K+-transporting ATPase KdpF subunit